MARRRGRRVPKATRDDEYAQLLAAAPSELYRDLFIMLRWAGLRISEAVGMKWEQVDIEAGSLLVRGKGNVERYIDILGPVEGVLRRRNAHQGDVPHLTSPHVFPGPTGQPLTSRAVQRVMQRLRDRLGIPPERCTPHKLRHRYATYLVERDVPLIDVRDQLGHANIATTSIYLHATPGRVRRIVERGVESGREVADSGDEMAGSR